MGGGLVPVLLFFVFVDLVVLGISAFGYSVPLLREPPASRRCRLPHEMHHRKMIRGRRGRCRYEG
jgi:hypothetical protein